MKPASISILIALILAPGYALASQPDPESYDLKQLLNPDGSGVKEADTVRISILRNMGETLGFRAGLAKRAKEITNAFEPVAKVMDRAFNFSTLVTADSALPPVIAEAQDVAAITPNQLRTSNKVYNILKPEEFISVPPTWRDYLYTGLQVNVDADFPAKDAQPNSSAEKEAWRDAVEKGWSAGSDQADQILTANFNRLTRDFNGMLRYSLLVKQGMITKTEVATSSHTVSSESTGKRLILGERQQQITKPAEFKINAEKWQPVVSKNIGTEKYTYGGR